MNESTLEDAIIEYLQIRGYQYTHGSKIHKKQIDVIIADDLKAYLLRKYSDITENEIKTIIASLENLSAGDLYTSNKKIITQLSEGFSFKREDHKKKDLFINLIDYDIDDKNIYRLVNQLEILGTQKRIPDVILFINGLPIVVFELKNPAKEIITIEQAYNQLTVRYQRDIPELFKYNALLVISDGVNSKYGSLFTPYEYFYTWRKKSGDSKEVEGGVPALFTLLDGLLDKEVLKNIIRNYIYFPDKSKSSKIICRYPQYFAAEAFHNNIKHRMRPQGNGKGGTYFGATGSGKSYTMLFLSRLLMRDLELKSPTILLITDRTDLDHQLSEIFTNAKKFIGDAAVRNITSRDKLREELQNRPSGGVFLTTVQKFTEDTSILSDRSNIICISDEAHRTQLNLDLNVRTTDKGVKKSYGFAKLLRDSLPNATYVGFTGTPIDDTMEVFGPIIQAYTMQESVNDGITVNIVYEGRAARVLLENRKLAEIESYYNRCLKSGSNEYEVEHSKKSTANLEAVLGDPKRLDAVAKDFVDHYNLRIEEKSTVLGKAMFVCSSRKIAWELYKRVIALEPEWVVPKPSAGGSKESIPIPKINLVMTRSKDDEKELYDLLGNDEYREELDRIFKDNKSNFKIAIVVDMWITGFDVPSLDTMYIDKPIQKHTLIQTISRVNRVFEGKDRGLIVDYIGIKRKMDEALCQYTSIQGSTFDDTDKFIVIVRDELQNLNDIFHLFNANLYYHGNSLEQLKALNNAVEYVQSTELKESRFMTCVKRMKRAYNLCSTSDEFSYTQRDQIHFYLAIRGILLKLTNGDAPDIAQMNARVREMIKEAIISDGVEALFNNDTKGTLKIDIFSEEYLKRIENLNLPNTKIKILQQLLTKLIDEYRKVNKIKAVDFTERMKTIVDKYNNRSEEDLAIQNDAADQLIDVIRGVINARKHHVELGITFEEEAFYDILKQGAIKYKFEYLEDKLLTLARKVKILVDDKSKYTDWSVREDIKASLFEDLVILLDNNGYPPVPREEVYYDVIEQAENFKKYS